MLRDTNDGPDAAIEKSKKDHITRKQENKKTTSFSQLCLCIHCPLAASKNKLLTLVSLSSVTLVRSLLTSVPGASQTSLCMSSTGVRGAGDRFSGSVVE